MKLRLKLLVSFALSLLTVCSTQECTCHQLRGVRIQLASGPRTVTVSLEKNQKLEVSIGDKYQISIEDKNRKSFTRAGSHTIYIKEKDSKFCVDSPTLPLEEDCARGGDSLFLLSSKTTTWALDCPPDSGGRTGYCSGGLHPLRLQAVMLGLDSGDFAFEWRPNDADTCIYPVWENYGQFYTNPGWNKILVSRGVNGRPCRVSNEALKINASCDNARDYLTFGSFHKNLTEVASDFALPCEDLQQDSAVSDKPERDPEGAPGTPSPSDVPSKPEQTEPPWNVWAIIGVVALVAIAVALVAIAVVLVVVKGRKSRSSREAAIPANDLHDPGRDDDREDDHDYCYVDVAFSNAQLEEERRATRTDCGGETASLRSHDSENSLYGTNLAEGRE